MDDFFTITAVGATVTTGATSAAQAIPVAGDGNRPRFIRIAATVESYVKLGTSIVVATTNDILVQPADAVVLQVPTGVTHVGYIQGTATGKVNITPLENL